jgi:hypothetical protein
VGIRFNNGAHSLTGSFGQTWTVTANGDSLETPIGEYAWVVPPGCYARGASPNISTITVVDGTSGSATVSGTAHAFSY